MSLFPCAKEPFVGTQQFEVPYSTQILPLFFNTKGAGSVTMHVCQRPVVPIWGVGLNPATDAYDFLPSTKGNEVSLIRVAQSTLLASRNISATPTVVGVDTYFSGDYPDYQARKVQDSPCTNNRYLEVYNKAVQFFTLHAAIGAFDIALYKELTDLQAKIMRESDKQMFIPPGIYDFAAASTAAIALQAWKTADANLVALYGVEIVTT